MKEPLGRGQLSGERQLGSPGQPQGLGAQGAVRELRAHCPGSFPGLRGAGSEKPRPRAIPGARGAFSLYNWTGGHGPQEALRGGRCMWSLVSQLRGRFRGDISTSHQGGQAGQRPLGLRSRTGKSQAPLTSGKLGAGRPLVPRSGGQSQGGGPCPMHPASSRVICYKHPGDLDPQTSLLLAFCKAAQNVVETFTTLPKCSPGHPRT